MQTQYAKMITLQRFTGFFPVRLEMNPPAIEPTAPAANDTIPIIQPTCCGPISKRRNNNGTFQAIPEYWTTATNMVSKYKEPTDFQLRLKKV